MSSKFVLLFAAISAFGMIGCDATLNDWRPVTSLSDAGVLPGFDQFSLGVDQSMSSGDAGTQPGNDVGVVVSDSGVVITPDSKVLPKTDSGTVTPQPPLLPVDAKPTGKTYYAAANASGGGNGSLAQPWTLAQAAANLQPGDIVYLRGGTYRAPAIELPVLRPGKSGTAGHYIHYVAYQSETPILKDGHVILDLADRNYIWIQGLTVTDPSNNWGYWVNLLNAHHNTINKVKFTFTNDSTGVAWTGIDLNAASYNRILNCNIDKWGIYGDPYNNGGDAVQINNGGHHNLVENCYIGSAGHAGLQIDGGYMNIIRNNVFDNDLEKGLEMTQRRPGTFEYNLTEGNTFIQAGYNPELHGGMHIHCNSNYNIIRRNVLRDANGWGIDMQVWGVETMTNIGNHFFHNTLVHNGIRQDLLKYWGGAGLQIDDTGYMASPHRDHRVKNNIFFDNMPQISETPAKHRALSITMSNQRSGGPWYNIIVAGNVFYEGGASTEVIWHSAFGNGTVAQFSSAHATNFFGNIQKDPMFTTYAVGAVQNPLDGTYDLRLKTGSPAIDAGADLTQTTAAGNGTVIAVEDSVYFHDGFNGMIESDTIRVGNQSVKIMKIDYKQHLITVDKSITWTVNTPVNLSFNGAKPDIGAYEK